VILAGSVLLNLTLRDS